MHIMVLRNLSVSNHALRACIGSRLNWCKSVWKKRGSEGASGLYDQLDKLIDSLTTTAGVSTETIKQQAASREQASKQGRKQQSMKRVNRAEHSAWSG